MALFLVRHQTGDYVTETGDPIGEADAPLLSREAAEALVAKHPSFIMERCSRARERQYFGERGWKVGRS
jgi:hypothetical protein